MPVPPYAQVETRGAKLQVLNVQFLEKRRQCWAAKNDFILPLAQVQAEGSLNQSKQRGGGPRLGRAGDRVRSRSKVTSALETAEEFGKPAEFLIPRRIKHP